MHRKVIIEPFRIKVAEPINLTTEEERIEYLKSAHYNPFLLKSKQALRDRLWLFFSCRNLVEKSQLSLFLLFILLDNQNCGLFSRIGGEHEFSYFVGYFRIINFNSA